MQTYTYMCMYSITCHCSASPFLILFPLTQIRTRVGSSCCNNSIDSCNNIIDSTH